MTHNGRVMSVFGISGFLHACAGWRIHPWWADLTFYTAMALIVILERVACLALDIQALDGSSWSISAGRRARQKWLGYIWVAGLFLWLLPVCYS